MCRWRELVGSMAHSFLDGLANDLATTASWVIVWALHVCCGWLGFDVIAALTQPCDVGVTLWDVDVDFFLHVNVVDLIGAVVTDIP